MLPRLSSKPRDTAVLPPSLGEVAFHAFIGDEEESGAWGRADDRGADAGVDASEAT